MSTWRDISSYSQNDKVRTPKTFEIKLGHERVVVSRHIHFGPDTWTVRFFGYSGPVELESKDLEDAKKEALGIVRDYLSKILEDLP